MLKFSKIKTYYFAVLNNYLSPKLANEQAIEDELNIDGGKHDLACFLTRNYFE